MTQISLERMEFYGYHGCFKEEHVVGTHFSVDIHIEIDTSSAEKSDDLQQTIDYQEVYSVVKQEFKEKSKLIENLAWRIATAVKVKFPVIEHITIKVSKLNPPVGGKVFSVSVTKTF